jgi:hypothetical protein
VIEYRLYYDQDGKVVSYTCDSLPGNYIVIDRQTFAEARPDIRVIKGKLVKMQRTVISKLKPSNLAGTVCFYDNVSIVLEEKSNFFVQNWELDQYEL